jgi:hypothetical protein
MFGMSLPQPHPRLVLDLFERLSGDNALWSSLRPKVAAFSRRRIYTLGVVVRLMILQRLLPGGGTLAQAVQQLMMGQADSKPSPHARAPIARRAKNCPHW